LLIGYPFRMSHEVGRVEIESRRDQAPRPPPGLRELSLR
jgi:hypothetical protein